MGQGWQRRGSPAPARSATAGRPPRPTAAPVSVATPLAAPSDARRTWRTRPRGNCSSFRAQAAASHRDDVFERTAPGPPGQRRRRQHAKVGPLGCVGQADPEVLRADGPPVLARHSVDHRLALGGVCQECKRPGAARFGEPPTAFWRGRDVPAQPDVEGILGRPGRNGDVDEGSGRPLMAHQLAGPGAGGAPAARVVHLFRARRAGDADGAALATDESPARRSAGSDRPRARRASPRLGQPDQVASRQQHGRPP